VSNSCLLRAEGLTKTYGAMTALSNASIAVAAGEVHALVGANGAGKSTLIKILTGAVRPNAGTVEIEGQVIEPGNPLAMIDHGISCIYQHSNLAPALDVLDNIYLGRQPVKGWGLLDRPRQRANAVALLAEHHIELDLDATVSDLSTVKQKEVEIAKALALNAKILLMDEPTAWLSHSEIRKLFETIGALKRAGVGIVYISHILDEIFEICDNVTILRDGKVVANCRVADISRQQLVKAFIGDNLATEAAPLGDKKLAPRVSAEPSLVCAKLGLAGVFANISFDVRPGELLCITGLIGAKRTELVRAIFGADRFDSGQISIRGQPIEVDGPIEAIDRGIGFVPEDRHRDGLMLNMPVKQNLVMASLRTFASFGLLSRRKIADAAARQIESLNILPPHANIDVGKLSGGNQQKVLIGKWLIARPQILILDEPTVGVDVHAKSEIYAVLRKLKSEGTALLVVSSDMEEVMMIADRIMVMCAGRVQGIYDSGAVTQQQIIAYAGGG
jgi:ABC-type sugar transport system ATPase subunit